jgi:hypothetical protein
MRTLNGNHPMFRGWVLACLIVIGISSAHAETYKRDILGVSLGMTLKRAVEMLKEKRCEPLEVGVTTAKTGTAMPNIHCYLPNGRDELGVFFTPFLADNPIWIVEYMFDSKLLPVEMKASVEQQFGFQFPDRLGQGTVSAKITKNLFIVLRPTRLVDTPADTYRYDLELRDVELREADDEAHKRKLEMESPPPKF